MQVTYNACFHPNSVKINLLLISWVFQVFHAIVRISRKSSWIVHLAGDILFFWASCVEIWSSNHLCGNQRVWTRETIFFSCLYTMLSASWYEIVCILYGSSELWGFRNGFWWNFYCLKLLLGWCINKRNVTNVINVVFYDF